MLNFKDNFFFIKFSVLFFILVIFGYWGIDLNSEEIYIAFSFFFLVIVGFVLSRKSILYFFIRSVNAKYMQQVSSYFYFLGHLEFQLAVYNELLVAYSSLIKIFNLLDVTRTSTASFLLCLKSLNAKYSVLVKLNVLFGVLCFFSEKNLARRFLSFKKQTPALFKFNLFE